MEKTQIFGVNFIKKRIIICDVATVTNIPLDDESNNDIIIIYP